MPEPRDTGAQRQIRLAAIVIIVAFSAWMAGLLLGGRFGLPVRYAFLLDLAAMAALVWALAVIYRVWRARQRNGV